MWLLFIMRAHFADKAVLIDLDSIPFGPDFRQHIASAIGQCDVMLALMGRNWAGEPGAPKRIDDPEDFVQIEIESALRRKLTVIPVL
jgi:hypothetical protein